MERPTRNRRALSSAIVAAARPLGAAATAGLCGALFAACALDFGGLTGGRGGSGSGGGGPGGGGSATASSAGGGGGGGTGGGASSTTSTTTATTATSTTGTGGSGGVPQEVLDCDPCPAGGCSPITLASGADANGPQGVALADDGVYWVNRSSNTILRLLQGAAGPEVLATGTSPVSIAVAGGYVAWAQEDGVWGCLATDCEASKVLIRASIVPGSASSVALDSQYVYFADHGDADSTGEVRRCPKAACPAPILLKDALKDPRGTLLYGSEVFWTERATGFTNGNVFRSPKGGQGATQVSGALNLPTAVAVTDQYVYWTESLANGRVLRCPNDMMYCEVPESVAPAAEPLATPRELVLFGGRLYWTSTGDGAIESCPLPGCGDAMPVTHVSGRPGLRGLAVGATCLFWTDDAAGGSVSKVGR